MRKSFFFLALSVLLACNVCPGAQAESKVLLNSSSYILDHPNLSRKVSLALNDTNIVDALVYLSEKAEINVAVSKSVQGRATISLNNVTIRDALDIILLSNELACEKRGEIFYVMPAQDYETMHGEKWSELRQVQIFKMQYAKPADVQTVLTPMLSRIGSVVVDNDTGTLVVMDTAEKIKQAREFIQTMDKQQETKVIDLKYANAKDVETFLAPKLDAKGSGSIKADEKYNRVVVTALPGKMEEVESAIRQLDSKIRQVLIEAKMVKVTLTPDFEFGIEWDKLFHNNPNKGTFNFESEFPFDSTLTNFGRIIVGRIGSTNVDATIQMLKTVGETKLLSSPRIAALNNEEAKIFVGTREVYTTASTTSSTGGSTTATSVNFVDVGIQLKVTPTINEDGMILMKIKPEISRVDRYFETPEGDEIPVVDTTQAETRVMVRDGNTIIIGGLIKDETQRDTNKIPVLGDIPFLGNAFKHIREDKEKTELVVFLTPHIIGADENMTEFDKKKMKPLKGYDELA